VSAVSTAALHLLLDIYAAVVAEDTSQTTTLEERSFSLFHVACSFARVRMAPFLMDEYYSNCDLRKVLCSKGRHGETLLMAAAALLIHYSNEGIDTGLNSQYARKQESIARGEELIVLLLDRATCLGNVQATK
jgi:hypothetical protein